MQIGCILHTLKGHRQLELCPELPSLVAMRLLFGRQVVSDFLQYSGLQGHSPAGLQASLSSTVSQSLVKHVSLESVMPSNHLILCCSLLLLSSVFPSIRVFTELVLHIRRPKYWSFNISISPCSEYSGEISFRMDWFDLLVVQGTLKSLLQHHSSKASVLQCSAFLIVQLSHPYMTTGKTITTLTSWVMSLTPLSLGFPCPCKVGICVLFSGWLQELKEMIASMKQSPRPGSQKVPGFPFCSLF